MKTGLELVEHLVKALFLAEEVIKSQNDGGCPVDIIEAVDEGMKFIVFYKAINEKKRQEVLQ
jgi:hypothetical protein